MSLMSLQNMVILDFLMSPSPTDRVRLLWPVGGVAATGDVASKQVKRFGSSASVSSPSAVLSLLIGDMLDTLAHLPAAAAQVG